MAPCYCLLQKRARLCLHVARGSEPIPMPSVAEGSTHALNVSPRHTSQNCCTGDEVSYTHLLGNTQLLQHLLPVLLHPLPSLCHSGAICLNNSCLTPQSHHPLTFNSPSLPPVTTKFSSKLISPLPFSPAVPILALTYSVFCSLCLSTCPEFQSSEPTLLHSSITSTFLLPLQPAPCSCLSTICRAV
jgi:hypothetical protein